KPLIGTASVKRRCFYGTEFGAKETCAESGDRWNKSVRTNSIKHRSGRRWACLRCPPAILLRGAPSLVGNVCFLARPDGKHRRTETRAFIQRRAASGQAAMAPKNRRQIRAK